jgi:hypothetical protein
MLFHQNPTGVSKKTFLCAKVYSKYTPQFAEFMKNVEHQIQIFSKNRFLIRFTVK